MNIINANTRHGLMLAILSMLLIACGASDDEALNRYINMVKARPAKPIEPLPEFKPLAQFKFPEDDHRRSPFKPKESEEKNTFTPNIKRPKQPLEAFPLDALKFVGELKQGATVWALISQPDGLVTRVKPGDYMGQNYGQIVLIKDKVIQLQEAVQVNGKWEKRAVSINLSVPD